MRLFSKFRLIAIQKATTKGTRRMKIFIVAAA